MKTGGTKKAAATPARRKTTAVTAKNRAARTKVVGRGSKARATTKRVATAKGRGLKAKIVDCESKALISPPQAIPRKAADMPKKMPKDAPKLIGGRRDTDAMARWLFGNAQYEEVSMSNGMRKILKADGRLDAEAREFDVVADRGVLIQILSANIDNRDTRPSKLKSMASDVSNENFKQTIAIPFIFSWDGHGIDLQHRVVIFLEAMDIHGIDHFIIRVILGMDPEIRFYLDQGAGRDVVDQLRYMKISFASNTRAAVSRSRAYELMVVGKRPIGGTKYQADRVAAMKSKLDRVHRLLMQRGSGGKVLKNQVAKNAGSHAAFICGIEKYGDIVADIARKVGKGNFRTGSALYAYTQWSSSFNSGTSSGPDGTNISFRMTVGAILACHARRRMDDHSELMIDDATLNDFINGKLFKRIARK